MDYSLQFKIQAMQIDLSLSNAKVYNVENFDLIPNQEFLLELHEPPTSGIKIFADNDPVLDLEKQSETSIKGTTKVVGASTVLIMSDTFQILKTLHVEVIEAIAPKAETLDAEVGEAVPK